MELKDLNVLVDGLNLELIEGTGIKTYGLSLLAALREQGAATGVLLSKYAVHRDKVINTDALAMFQKKMVQPWLRLNLPLIASAFLGQASTTRSLPLPPDLVITKGVRRFAFINENALYMSRGCYILADALRFFGLTIRLKANPRVDVWHTTYFTPIIVKGAAKVTTIHDLVPLRLPYATTNDKGVFVRQVRDAIRQSQLIISVSETTKNDLLRFFDVDPDKVVVTYQPIVLDTSPLTEDEISRKLRYYNLERGKYVLFVGAMEPKKNLRRLINAWLSMDCDLPLALVGKRAWLWEEELRVLYTKEHTRTYKRMLKQKFRLLEYVPNADLSAIYQGAQCLVFPSLYEGFGLPVLEAMSAGCPVITSSVASLPEVCGDAALYVNPYDTMDIAAKLDTLLRDEALRKRLRTAGLDRARLFSRENYRQRLRNAYAQL